MQFENDFEVPAPPAAAWALLNDLDRVVPCLPGAALTQVVDGDTYRGELGVRLGPVAVTFAGEMRYLERDAQAHRARVAASARELRNRGHADATFEFRIAPRDGGGSRVTVATDLTLSGPVARYGRGAGVIERVAGALLARFASCLASRIEAGEGAPR